MTKTSCLKSALEPGGDDISIFAGDLLRMYLRYADKVGLSPRLLVLVKANWAAIKK